MIFATDQKIPQTRQIDYYELTSRNVYASNAAKRFMIAAADAARANGIVINTIGIGGAVRLPEYLDQTASSGQAYIVPRDISNAQVALRDEMVASARQIYTITENVVITDRVPRRSSPYTIQNDGTFELDLTSFRVAYVQTPASPVIYQPVDINSSDVVSVSFQPNSYDIAFAVGDLWSAEAAAAGEGRYYRSILQFQLAANQGVISNNRIGIPDMRTNLNAAAIWTEAGLVMSQSFPPASVYIPETCSIFPPVPPAPPVPPGPPGAPPVIPPGPPGPAGPPESPEIPGPGEARSPETGVAASPPAHSELQRRLRRRRKRKRYRVRRKRSICKARRKLKMKRGNRKVNPCQARRKYKIDRQAIDGGE
ncbi:hypothetical protein [Paenibacillus sp. 7541]|uniref:hypothetical protein n=1 Tax=Paenibacillus sp. 7541 TaxID=2026236 RepID=UPI0015962991|nr:hypothetical protein [Paenibacillus sp. 7541]